MSIVDELKRPHKVKETTMQKEIDCPFADGHKAIVTLPGDDYPGIVTCTTCDAEDGCEHPETHVDTVEQDIFEPVFGHDTREVKVYVCDTCECTVDGDPVGDAAADRADMEYDEMRDNQND